MAAASKIKILIIEDEMIIAADISMNLTKLGYEVVGILTKAEGILENIANNRPDIVLMDISLAGKLDGIDAASMILENDPIPVVFLTSNTDDATFKRALKAKPFAFVSKPFRVSEIQRTLKLIEHRIRLEQEIEPDSSIQEIDSTANDHVTSLKDRLFLHHKNQLVKVVLSDILFVEAERNYCKVHTKEETYMLSVPLINLAAQLPNDQFLRVHRSFIVNLQKIDSANGTLDYLHINSHQIPISRRMKDDVKNRLTVI